MGYRHGLLRALREPRSANELLITRVTILAMVTVILVLVGGFVFYRLERSAPGSEVTTYGDALFWTSSQITTISSSLANPISTGGRIFAVLIDLASIAVVSLLFGSIAQHIHHLRAPSASGRSNERPKRMTRPRSSVRRSDSVGMSHPHSG